MGVAANVTGDRDLLVHLDVVDDVVRGNRVDRDAGAGRVRSDRVMGASAVGAAHAVNAADRGGDTLARDSAAGHADAVAAVRGHGAGANHRAADHQGHRVARVGATTDAAGHLYRLADFDVVDDVVRRHIVDRDAGRSVGGTDIVGRLCAVCAAGGILAADRSRDRLAGHRTARHADAVAAVGGHRAGADHGIADHQGNGVTRVGAAADAARDLHGLVHLDVVDDVVCRDVIDGDRGAGRIHAHSVSLAGAVGAARSVGAVDHGGDGLALNGAAQHVDAVASIGRHGAGANHRAANHQRDHIARMGVATHGARHRHLLVGFNVVDRVVCRDAVDRDRGAGRVDRDIVRDRGREAVARRVVGGHTGCHAGLDGVIGQQVSGLDIDAVDQLTALISNNQSAIGVAVDQQRDRVTQFDVAAHRAADIRVGCLGLDVIDDVVAGDGVDGDIGGNVEVGCDSRSRCSRGAGRSCRVGGGDAGVDGVVGDQVGCLDVDAVDQRRAGATGYHAGIGVAIDQQRDDIANLDVAANGAGNHGGGLGCFGDVDDVVAGNGADGDGGRHIGRDQRLGLQIRLQARSGKTVVVGQRLHAFGDAQQLHEGAAAIGADTTGYTGRRGVQSLVQIRAAFERLDDGVGGGRCRHGAVLGRGAMVGLDHVFIEAHGLRRCNTQDVPVFHHEIDPHIAHGADGFALLQLVTDLEGAAHACGVDCEYGAIAIDGCDGCKLGHDDLQ